MPDRAQVCTQCGTRLATQAASTSKSQAQFQKSATNAAVQKNSKLPIMIGVIALALVVLAIVAVVLIRNVTPNNPFENKRFMLAIDSRNSLGLITYDNEKGLIDLVRMNMFGDIKVLEKNDTSEIYRLDVNAPQFFEYFKDVDLSDLENYYTEEVKFGAQIKVPKNFKNTSIVDEDLFFDITLGMFVDDPSKAIEKFGKLDSNTKNDLMYVLGLDGDTAYANSIEKNGNFLPLANLSLEQKNDNLEIKRIAYPQSKHPKIEIFKATEISSSDTFGMFKNYESDETYKLEVMDF
ncbi:MAG: hypothetical protein Q4E22_01650 [Coriobacteriia bacterium]|nr:hypothetical protein [Coriobacteriia bacterium]